MCAVQGVIYHRIISKNGIKSTSEKKSRERKIEK